LIRTTRVNLTALHAIAFSQQKKYPNGFFAPYPASSSPSTANEPAVVVDTTAPGGQSFETTVMLLLVATIVGWAIGHSMAKMRMCDKRREYEAIIN
jgi:hypothetical protein